MAKSSHTPEQLLSLLQAVIRDAPTFQLDAPVGETELKWLSRSDAILAACAVDLAVFFRVARQDVGTWAFDRTKLMLPLYDALSRLELLVPSSLQGAFIPPGNTWDAYSAITKVVQTDCNDILVIDPYLNADIFIHYAPHSGARSGLRCLTAQRGQNHLGLVAAATKWQADPQTQAKPVEVRYADSALLHDRLIILDGKEVWLVSQSFKDIAKRSAASVTKADAELAQMKASHYEAIWNASTPLT